MARLEVRLSDDMLERWTAAALTHGWSVSELVRDSVNAAIGEPVVTFAADLEEHEYGAAPGRAATPSPPETSPVAPAKPKRRRTAMCDHRNPPNVYCSRCD